MKRRWPHSLVPGLTVVAGERWAEVPGCPGFAVSTEGRAVRLPGKLPQRSRWGGTFERSLPGSLTHILEDRPRIGHKANGSRMDLGRAVLTAFVRPPSGRELAASRPPTPISPAGTSVSGPM